MNSNEIPDVTFLRLIIGSYDESASNKYSTLSLAVGFMLLAPALFAFALIYDGKHIRDWNVDYWAAASMIPCSFLLGAWILKYVGGEYTFDEQKIVLKRWKREVGRIYHDEIVRATIHSNRHGHLSIHLFDSKQKFLLYLHPELKARVLEARSNFSEIFRSVHANK